MDYPVEFVQKVKLAHPVWQELHKALDSGSKIVGRLLDDSRGSSMRPEEIVEAFEQGRQDKMLAAAKKAVECNRLYLEWGNIFYG